MALLSTPLKHRVQSFLTDTGTPPGSDLTRNFEQICMVMQRRREDDAFWARLTELVRELVDSVVKSKNPAASLPPEARLLALWDVNELAQLLRTALPHDPPPDTDGIPLGVPKNRFSRGLPANGLGFCLLLSLAASACGASDSHDGTNNVGGGAATGGAVTTSAADAGSGHTGGAENLGGSGGTAVNSGGSASVGGAALGGTSATSGANQPLTGGRTAFGGTSSSVLGGSSQTGGTQSPGGSGGSINTAVGGNQSLGGNSATANTATGGTQSLGGNGGTFSAVTGGTQGTGGTIGTVGTTGGSQSTGGATLSCETGNVAGATSIGGHALPPSCCVDTASALWEAIDDSTLEDSQKETLYACFVNLNATWCDGLVDLFKTQTAQVIAQSLSELLLCCQYVPGKLTGDFATVRQDLINRMICSVALYKGVTFPS